MAMDRALAADVQTDPLTTSDLAALEAALGYAFRDRKLLSTALTHIGAAASRPESYQRLEFLGDRVLGLVVAGMLYAAFPETDEGDLSRRLADLVRRESCAEVAQDWGVALHIRVAAGERAVVALRKAVLGDVCEAIIGAVYLDGGLEAACSLVERSFAERMRAPRRLRDAKTTLQEWAQARGRPIPAYRIVSRHGPEHAPEFTISVAIDGYGDAEAKGASKRLAEQAAAAAFLAREGVASGAPA